jgi:signal transduction histidine kinase
LAALRILIVDDSPEDRELYRRQLAGGEDEIELVESTSGEEGLRRCAAEPIDCVLLDYRLPDLDGLEFLSLLAGEVSPPPPVIVLTGQGNESVAVQAMKSGAQDYLLKGAITRESLQRAVQNAIEKAALLRRVEQRTAELEQEVRERQRAELALQRTFAELEHLVAQRTAELSTANQELRREIGERQRAEEERAELLVREREARQQAEQANRLKDEFLATLSHELRTPLNAILGWATVLRGGRLDAATNARAVEAIERNARAQAGLVADLLDVSRIITGKLRLELQPVDLGALVAAVEETLRPAAEAKSHRLEVRVGSYPAPIAGDPDRLQQVIWNLASNAIKFTPEGGSVAIELRRAGSNVELEVRDTGIGIRPDFLPYVFDRFRQAESSTTRAHGGLGIGLAIVRHLVELHGGSVEVHSDGVGAGARFVVRLPARLASVAGAVSPTPAARAPWQPRTTLGGVRVLVVEDEKESAELVRTTLEQCGADVDLVPSVAAFFSHLEREVPNVLVSDIGLPGEDGYSLIRRLRARGAQRGGDLPAIALTAYAGPDDRERAIAAGYQLHLAKPFEPDDLARSVALLTGR